MGGVRGEALPKRCTSRKTLDSYCCVCLDTIVPYWYDTFSVFSFPALIYGFSGGKKTIKFYFATTEQNIACVNLFRKPTSNSSILKAIDVLVAICSIHLLW